MRIKDILENRKSGVSFEFFPPKSVAGKDKFMNVVHDLKKHDPLYVSVTYGAGGSTQERTLNTLKWIKGETDLTVMSHLTCIGATSDSMGSLLREYKDLGVDNILALRGDPPRDAADFDPTKGQFKYAADLVRFVKELKSFSIGVAVYPEGHQESPDIDKDIEYTKMKIDAGADFGITQMFFDNKYYYEFMDRAKKAGISIPILPGIMPVVDCRKIEEFADFCSATVPKELKDIMYPVLDRPDEMKKIGIDYAISQCKELINNGVQFLHFYSMNRSDIVDAILRGLQ